MLNFCPWIYLFFKAHSFLQADNVCRQTAFWEHSWRKTVSIREQIISKDKIWNMLGYVISEHISTSNERYCLYHTCEVHVQFQNWSSKQPVHQQTCIASQKMLLVQCGAIVHHWCKVLSWTCKVPGSLWWSHQVLHEVSASDSEAICLN